MCDPRVAECQLGKALSTLYRILDTSLKLVALQALLSMMSYKFLGIIISIGLHIAETPGELGHECCACHDTEERYISIIKIKTCLGFAANPYMSVITMKT